MLLIFISRVNFIFTRLEKKHVSREIILPFDDSSGYNLINLAEPSPYYNLAINHF
jgi:hypothetical protein